MAAADNTVILPEPAPRRLAQYELLRRVGAGAMGAVFLGRDTDLDRKVAIKLLHGAPGQADPPAKLERFLREARTAAQLVHPNVAIVYQIGRQDDVTFIVMEWLDGMDLGRWVDTQGPMPWREALLAACDAASGLAAAHAAGLVHRDVKPSNLMRTPSGQVKLVDFGLARWHGMASDVTQVGGVMGTPGYLSPEQCCGDDATPASDVYALGCTLYALLSGRMPFDADKLQTVMYLQMTAPMPDVRELVPDVPEAVAALVQHAGAKRAEDRPQSAAAMLEVMRDVLDGHPLASRRPSTAATTVMPEYVRPAHSRAANTVTPAPAPAPTPAPGKLPADATSFVGREALLARSLEMLGQTRLLTLIGPGGTGKTRLSLQTARQAAPQFADGAWFVELATVPAGHEIDSVIAAELGVPEAAGRAVAASIIDKLKSSRMLLVLDNCEQVIQQAAAFVAPLLAAAPGLKVLATSRQPLGVPGEDLLPVPPLALADDGASAEELQASEAVQLFAARARAVRPSFTLDAANTEAVLQICRRLDGIPLAIELAAARVKVLSPAQIASRLGDAFKLLVGGQRTLLVRQQTLRALFDWSYDLLDARERLVFERLAVFRGDFDLEAAEAVLPDELLDDSVVLDVLTELVDRSLLIATDHDGTMRFRLLQTTQQYAAERLGACVPLHRRHGEHFLQRVAAAVAQFNGKEHAVAMAHIAREADNARAALEAATAQRWFDISLPLASALASYWLIKGVAIDGIARVERLLAEPPQESTMALAALYRVGGSLALYLDRRALAATWYKRGLEIARKQGDVRVEDDVRLEGALLRGLGNLAIRENQLERATEHYHASAAAAQSVGDRLGEGMALHNLAVVAGEQRRYEEARDYLQKTLQISREIGARRPQAEALRNLALAEWELGNDSRAYPLFDECVELERQLGAELGAATTHSLIGHCKLVRGDLVGARDALQEALDTARRLDDHALLASVLDLLAVVVHRGGESDRALKIAHESLALRRSSENPADLALSLVTFAELRRDAAPEHSARMLGAAAALRAQHGAQLQARRQAMVDAVSEPVTAQLGAAAYARLFDEGHHLDPAALLTQCGPA